MRLLQVFRNEVWTAEGETVSFHGMPYTTRMTIVRLGDGALWVHSPVAPSEALVAQVVALGEPRHLVSPNKLHHLYLGEWRARFPRACLYAPPGLRRKRPDLPFAEDLPAPVGMAWAGEIEQLLFEGSFAMQEVVFFHRASGTLILGDLVENFPEGHFCGWRELLAKATGIVSPHGGTPLDWRMSFVRRSAARRCLERMLAWNPQAVVLAHGECIPSDAVAALRRAFAWL